MPLVVVALARQGAPVRELQIPLGPLQCLDRRFFIDTEEQSPWPAGQYRDPQHRQLSPRTQGHCSRTRTCGRPDRYCVRAGSAKHIERQHPPAPGPTADPSIGHSLAVAAYPEAPECAGWSSHRRSASVGAQAVLKSSKAVIGKTPPPFADDTRLNTHFLSDRARAAALSRQRDYPRTRHLALWRARPRQRASSTLRTFDGSRTSLALGIIPILNYDLPAKKSGY